MKQRRKAIQFFFIVIVFSTLALFSCTKREIKEPVSQSELLLGTVSRITLYDKQDEDIFKKGFERIQEIEERMDFHTTTSEIARINERGYSEPVKVSADTFLVVERALEMARLSGGAFDPTVGPLVEAWGIGGDNPRRPPQEEIDHLLQLIDYSKVTLNPDELTIGLLKEGMQLDLGGIAKGYAADEVAKVLKESGVNSAIINLGGNVLTVGEKPDGTHWRIGIQNPHTERGGHAMIVNVDEKTVVTSGPYERYAELDGVIYHHILDTQSGYPVESDLLSVTIITEESLYADALSTTLYSLGLKEGLALIDSLDNVEAIFIDTNNTIYLSKGFEEGLYPYSVTDPQFKIGKTE